LTGATEAGRTAGGLWGVELRMFAHGCPGMVALLVAVLVCVG
jgi:hypothetical protein